LLLFLQTTFFTRHHPKFEKAVTHPSMTEETKVFFINEMLRTIDMKLFSEEQVFISPKVLQDMTDVRVLELMQNNEIKDAISYIASESVQGILPSKEVLQLIVQNLVKSQVECPY
jgi:hypothetical protein